MLCCALCILYCTFVSRLLVILEVDGAVVCILRADTLLKGQFFLLLISMYMNDVFSSGQLSKNLTTVQIPLQGRSVKK